MSQHSELTSPGHIKFLQALHSGVFPSFKPFMKLQNVGFSSEVQIRKLYYKKCKLNKKVHEKRRTILLMKAEYSRITSKTLNQIE